jgi:hypothetical protein
VADDGLGVSRVGDLVGVHGCGSGFAACSCVETQLVFRHLMKGCVAVGKLLLMPRVWRLFRTGTIDPNATTTNQRAATFAASAPDGAVLLTRRDDDGLSHWLIAPDAVGVAQSALHLAQTVAARAEELVDDIPELFASKHIAVARYQSGSIIGRDTQVGSDLSEIAGRLASALSTGEWVAAVLRRPNKREVRWYKNWLSHQIGGGNLPQHHSMQQTAVVMSIWSGADTTGEAKALLRQVTAAMPGFDVQITPHPVSKMWGGLITIAVGLLAFIAGVWALNTEVFYLSDAVELMAGFAAGLGLPVAAGGVLFMLGRVPSYAEKVRRLARYNLLLEPASRLIPPARPQREQTDKDGANVAGSNGQYPLDVGSFMAGAQLAVGIVAPHAGAASGTSSTQMRVAPSAMRDPIGPLIGDNDGRAVHLSSADAWQGVALFGQAGSGKLLALDVRIPVPVSARFPSGWALNSELEIGDLVFDLAGELTSVVRFSPVEDGDNYEIEFVDGQRIVADARHGWNVSTTRSREFNSPKRGREAEHIGSGRAAIVMNLRDSASAATAGTGVTAADVSILTGLTRSRVWALAREMGMEAFDVEIPEGRAFTIPRREDRFVPVDAAAAMSQHRGGSRLTVTAEGLERLRSFDGPDVSVLQVATALEGAVPNSALVATVAAALYRVGVRKTRVTTLEEHNSLSRTVQAYPAAEFLTGIADAIELRRFRPETVTVTTGEMAERMDAAATSRREFAVPVVGIAGPEVELEIDPYVLGAWLGDGSTNSGGFTGIDPGITDEIEAAGFKMSHNANGKSHHIFDLIEKLRTVGVAEAKHIPASYLRASASQRLALLQGLMDTDGTVDKKGACELTLSDTTLAHDVLELIRSLGIRVAIKESAASYTLTDVFGTKSRHPGKNRFRMSFTTDVQVFRLERKVVRLPKTVRSTQSWNHIAAIRRVPSSPVRCITVADKRAQFLVEGFIPTHNSRLVQSLFAHAGLERVRPSGRPGFTGAQNSLIAFESKGEGADAYVEWSKIVDDQALRIDFAGPGSVQLDILSIPGTADVRARAVVNAMKYAFSDGAIQERSFDTLTQVLTAGFVVTTEVAAAAELPASMSPFFYANILLGGRGDAAGVALAGAIRSEAARLQLGEDTEFGHAAAQLQALYSGKTPAQRSTFTDAPRSKVSALLAAESWWGRPNKISWDRLLTEHRSVIINTGVTASGHEADDTLVSQFSAMMMHTLYSAIKRCCSEWRDAGRSVSLYADELKLLAGNTSTVITWLKDQGRSYGVRTVFATQYPEQLAPEVRNAVMGYGTLLAFSQSNPEVVKGLVADLSLSGDLWTGADVANLPAFEAIVRASVGQQRQAPFTLSIRDFWSNRSGFAEEQGYGK